jgi:hypothetical protein
MCVPNLVEIATGVPELCPDIHTHTQTSIFIGIDNLDRLCGLVDRIPDLRSRGQGSIPGANRFSEK